MKCFVLFSLYIDIGVYFALWSAPDITLWPHDFYFLFFLWITLTQWLEVIMIASGGQILHKKYYNKVFKFNNTCKENCIDYLIIVTMVNMIIFLWRDLLSINALNPCLGHSS